MNAGGSSLSPNREHRDQWPVCSHGAVVTMLAGLGHFVTCHEDGTVFVSIPEGRQRRPYRLDPARDGEGLRAHERGEHGRRARAAARPILGSANPIVEQDRRGGSSGLSDHERGAIVKKMHAAIDGGATVTRSAHDVAALVGRSHRTVLSVWWRETNRGTNSVGESALEH